MAAFAKAARARAQLGGRPGAVGPSALSDGAEGGEFPPGSRVLDFACGGGGFAVEAARRGLEPSGADPSPGWWRWRALFCPARISAWRRSSACRGITGFSCVANPLDALHEARRVVRSGGKVMPAVWGRPEDCEISAWAPWVLLVPAVPGRSAVPFEYPDLTSGLRGLQASTPALAAAARDAANRVAAITADFLSRHRAPGGCSILHNCFRMLVARR